WLNMQSFQMGCGKEFVQLPKLEYKIMELLMLNQSIFLSTEDMLVKIWGYDTDTELGIVWVYISYLRKKIQQLGSKAEIRVKRGIGYRLEDGNGN
ncbi:MAG: winged helix-turn-helix transcriptional regulator, partial [Oscillospiraceae bacterium]|nr:winged helix-turn-helix transcriptional regulator [Oscillospiraceae bacterium]